MMQHHNYSLSELEEMLPWEREIYVGMLMNYLEEEKRKRKEECEEAREKQDSLLFRYFCDELSFREKIIP